MKASILTGTMLAALAAATVANASPRASDSDPSIRFDPNSGMIAEGQGSILGGERNANGWDAAVHEFLKASGRDEHLLQLADQQWVK
jgi:hypothetical protein